VQSRKNRSYPSTKAEGDGNQAYFKGRRGVAEKDDGDHDVSPALKNFTEIGSQPNNCRGKRKTCNSEELTKIQRWRTGKKNYGRLGHAPEKKDWTRR